MTDSSVAPFDRFAGTYQDAVEQSIGFVGRGLDFFAQAKVDHLVDLGSRLVGSLHNASVLDVGCGNGGTDRLLMPHVRSLTGVDVSPAMALEATCNNPEGKYFSYDGLKLPFDSCSFDVTFAICVMHHVPPANWDSFVADLTRVTRRDGVVLVFEHNPLNPLTRRAVSNCVFDGDAVLLRPRRVQAAFVASGLKQAARRYIVFAPFGGGGVRRAERIVSWLPLGAQYVVAGRR